MGRSGAVVCSWSASDCYTDAAAPSARVAKLADARDVKISSTSGGCGFNSSWAPPSLAFASFRFASHALAFGELRQATALASALTDYCTVAYSEVAITLSPVTPSRFARALRIVLATI